MRIFKKVLLGLAILIVVLVAVAYVLPRRMHAERSVTIQASPAEVFAILNSYKRFNEWSPWAGKDPNAKYTYEGPEAGVGASMSWTGNSDVGVGKQTITESKPDQLVKTHLAFGDGDAEAAFTLSADGTGTKVTWSLDADMGMNPIGRWFGLFFDGMIGKDYDQGLAKLKALLESKPPASK